jgi:Zn-dependent protease
MTRAILSIVHADSEKATTFTRIVPVLVSPLFWLGTGILGLDFLRAGAAQFVLWIGCVFVSILWHELGHVWMGHYFGTRGAIVLYMMGGLAVGASNSISPWRRIAVILAGPGIQLAVGVPMWLLMAYTPLQIGWPDWPPFVQLIWKMLTWINIGWALFNLVPVYPLDGGQVCVELCQRYLRHGLERGFMLSTLMALLLIVNTIAEMNGYNWLPIPTGGMLFILFFGLLAAENYQRWQQLAQSRGRWLNDDDDDDRPPWQR